MEQILKFLDYNKFPLVNRLTESNSATVYSSPLKLQVSDTYDIHTSYNILLLEYVDMYINMCIFIYFLFIMYLVTNGICSSGTVSKKKRSYINLTQNIT